MLGEELQMMFKKIIKAKNLKRNERYRVFLNGKEIKDVIEVRLCGDNKCGEVDHYCRNVRGNLFVHAGADDEIAKETLAGMDIRVFGILK